MTRMTRGPDGPTPRERFITLYGRMPVLSALRDVSVVIDKVVVSRRAQGEAVLEILAAATSRGIAVERATQERVTRLSRNGRHDQGVVADIEAPGLEELDAWLERQAPSSALQLIVLDGVTNPANVGMIVRTVTAAGLDGVVLPRAGSPDVGPLLIKASAGVALRAAILRTATASSAVDALSAAGFELHGLRGNEATTLWDTDFGERVALVLGNETDGISAQVASRLASWVAIPLANNVESLNVAAAAAVVGYELSRRRTSTAS
jgi:23S rRNA (guanosine2251-2'-O)-methyltransferase